MGLKAFGYISRSNATMIDDMIDGRLSDKMPLGSFTDILSTVNYNETITLLEEELGIYAKFEFKMSELNVFTEALKESLRFPFDSVKMEKAVCSDDICISVQVGDTDLRVIYKELASEYNVMDRIVRVGGYPNLSLRDDMVLTLNTLPEYLNVGIVNMIYDMIIASSLKTDIDDTFIIDCSLDRSIFHYMLLLKNTNTLSVLSALTTEYK